MGWDTYGVAETSMAILVQLLLEVRLKGSEVQRVKAQCTCTCMMGFPPMHSWVVLVLYDGVSQSMSDLLY